MAAKFVKFVLKSAVAGGLIYVTVNVTNSTWITPNYSIPHRDNRMFVHKHFEENHEPSVDAEFFKEAWNRGVQRLFHGLLVAPDAAKELSDRACAKIKNSYKTNEK